MLKTIFKTLLVLFVSAPAFAAYDKPYIGEMKIYPAKHEDTLVYIARDNNLGFVEMRAANPDVDPWLPGEGTKLVIPTRHLLPDAPYKGIVINLPEMRLYAFINGENEPESYPIGIGREGLATPLGTTEIVRKQVGPTWRPTPRMREENPKLPESIGPGPDNPLGDYAMYLGWAQYAIHGTNKPFGIGRRVSSGCIRMYPEGIEALFQRIPIGTPVRVVDQPIKLAWIENELYLEAHPDIEQAFQMEETGQIYSHQLDNEDLKAIINVAGKYKDDVDWALVRHAVKERKGYPIKIAERPQGSEPVPGEQKRGQDRVENKAGADEPESSEESKTAS